MTDAQQDAALRVQSLIDITDALSAIMLKENDLLTSQRAREIAPLQAEKARLAAAYAQSIRDIAANRASVNAADSVLLSELRDITKTFEERAANQRALLNGAAKAAEGVVKSVAAEAANEKASASYGADNTGAPSTPISVNENA